MGGFCILEFVSIVTRLYLINTMSALEFVIMLDQRFSTFFGCGTVNKRGSTEYRKIDIGVSIFLYYMDPLL